MYRGAAVPWTGLTFCAAEKTLCNFQGYVAHTQLTGAANGQRGPARGEILTFPETPTSTTQGLSLWSVSTQWRWRRTDRAATHSVAPDTQTLCVL